MNLAEEAERYLRGAAQGDALARRFLAMVREFQECHFAPAVEARLADGDDVTGLADTLAGVFRCLAEALEQPD